MFVMLTDVPCVYLDYGSKQQKCISAAHPDVLEAIDFAAGSMGPKVRGACRFVRETGHASAIGQLSDLASIMRGEAGTLITSDVEGIEYAKQE